MARHSPAAVGDKTLAEAWTEHQPEQKELEKASYLRGPVFDGFDLLAFLRGEAGDDKVTALLENTSLRDARFT